MAFKKPFYGWVIAFMGTLGNAVQGGVIFWSMGIYTSTFEDEFGASRAKINLIESCLSIGVNVIFPFVGFLVDKWSLRATVAIGALSMGTGLIVTSMAGSLIAIWAAFALLVPLGVLALGALPSSTAISRWFRKKRGLAMGIALAGSSIGGAFIPPVVTFLFMAYGWRTALLCIGLFVIALAPVFFFALANHPKDMGLEQEEEGNEGGAALTAVDQVDWSVKDILTTGQFWLQTVISATMLSVTLGLLANLSLHAKDQGLTLQQSATLYSIIAFFSFCGKVAIGGLFDKFGLKKTGILTGCLMVTGLIILSLAKDPYTMMGACVFLGMAFGGVTPTWTNMISRGFGAKSFGRTMGIMNPMHIPITAGGAPLAGYISDTTGSYEIVFAAYIVMISISAIALLWLKPPVHPSSTLADV